MHSLLLSFKLKSREKIYCRHFKKMLELIFVINNLIKAEKNSHDKNKTCFFPKSDHASFPWSDLRVKKKRYQNMKQRKNREAMQFWKCKVFMLYYRFDFKIFLVLLIGLGI